MVVMVIVVVVVLVVMVVMVGAVAGVKPTNTRFLDLAATLEFLFPWGLDSENERKNHSLCPRVENQPVGLRPPSQGGEEAEEHG